MELCDGAYIILLFFLFEYLVDCAIALILSRFRACVKWGLQAFPADLFKLKFGVEPLQFSLSSYGNHVPALLEAVLIA